MALEIEGKIKAILPMREGEGRNGHWSSQDFVVEIPGQYPRDVAVTVFNGRVDIASLVQGDNVKVSIDLSSREYQGRWYTSVTAWKVEKVGVGTPVAGAPVAAAPSAGAPSGPVEQTQAGGDDLPF